ncbi:MAG: molecular chaperone DnaJ [Rhodospirillaceae bacterium]|nr:molecular chaperone DnaJ [Rhodospirillaceae bacterium]
MAKQDYYDVLGVARGASTDDIKKSFRKLAMQFHPDRHQGDKEAEHKFREINEAYDILKDDEKRAAYDRYGHAAFENGGGRPGGTGFEFNFGAGFADIFDEMFGDVMGGRRGGQGAPRGGDVRFNLKISLEEAFKGRQTTIRVPSLVLCESCGATGAAGGSKPIACGTCQGHGKVRQQSGFFTIERTCPACQGAGRVIEKPCRSCSGQGRVRKERTLAVNVPPGVEDGTRIRLAGEGEAGVRGSPPGDLYLFVEIAPHKLFQREGADLLCRVPIPMTTAALGGDIEVPTIDAGRVRINVPAGTQTGQQVRLRTKGMSVLRSNQRGDLFVELIVETPVNLNQRQEELLRDFDGAGNRKQTSPQSEGFFAKVRELWEDLRE